MGKFEFMSREHKSRFTNIRTQLPLSNRFDKDILTAAFIISSNEILFENESERLIKMKKSYVRSNFYQEKNLSYLLDIVDDAMGNEAIVLDLENVEKLKEEEIDNLLNAFKLRVYGISKNSYN
ncbi:hypothetical protein BTS2_3318 [Bacillus sp. TS-2]|nr:hypothetical protein BTS2_3318 [Bacillus sp. TS-2]